MNNTNLFDIELDAEILDLVNFLEESERQSTGFVTKKRILDNAEGWCRVLNQWLCYPDLLVDLMTPKDSEFRLYPFQRIILRSMSRYTQGYFVFSRGTSKSFLAFLNRFIHADLTPRHKTGIIAGSKRQAASIAKEKIIDDLWNKFPLLANEMQKRRVAGKLQDAYNSGSDYARFNFKNGSWLDVASDRGLRRDSIILEEIIEQDATFVREVALPWLSKARTTLKGRINPKEPQAQKIFVTTAGYQGTYAYEKLVATLAMSVFQPDKYIVMTGSYKLPLYHNLVNPQEVEDRINDPSYTKDSFDREYLSIWSDAPAGAAFSSAAISKLRKIKRVELKNKIPEDNDDFYVISADMAKDGDAATAIVIARVSPKDYFFTYKIINLLTINNSDYMFVANRLKELVLDYDAKLLIYDANGIGAALRDWINKETITEENVPLSGLGIINPPKDSEKDIIKYPSDQTIVYEIKSSGQKGAEIHHFFFARMSNGSIAFPIRLNDALELYAKNESFIKMGQRRKEALLLPYKMMDLAEQQFKNLDIVDTSDKVTKTMQIGRRSAKIQKDFFSASEYLVYGTNQVLEMNYYKKRRQKKNSILDAFIFE